MVTDHQVCLHRAEGLARCNHPRLTNTGVTMPACGRRATLYRHGLACLCRHAPSSAWMGDALAFSACEPHCCG